MEVMEMFRKKFETYRKILDESGEYAAHDALFAGYPERQKESMGPFINDCTLAEGFAKSVDIYKTFGMIMKVVDISNHDRDGVIEVHYACPFIDMAKEFGFDRPCAVICDMDVEAAEAAFEGMTGRVLSRQADGDCVCIFKYERPQA